MCDFILQATFLLRLQGPSSSSFERGSMILHLLHLSVVTKTPMPGLPRSERTYEGWNDVALLSRPSTKSQAKAMAIRPSGVAQYFLNIRER